MKKRLFSILLSLSVMLTGILAMSTTAMAATGEVTGIQAEQTVDTSSGNIKVTLKVTAENEYNIEGLALENKAPNGYKLFSGEATKKIAKLKSGESEILTTVFTKESGAVKTGDSNSNHMLMYGGIAVLSAALIVLLLSRKKGRNKMFMLLLCCVMVASGVVAFTGEAFAGEGNPINLSKDVTVGSETVTVNSVVSYNSVVQNKYNVTAQVQGDHGTATVRVGEAAPTSETTQAVKGTSLKFAAIPKEGYTFDHWEVVSGGITLKDATVNSITVTMPANALTLKAHFKVAYSIIVEDDGHGTAGADPTSAAPGASVTLSATAKDGYAFKEWVDMRENAGEFDNTKATTTLTMPSNDIKVKAVFERVYNINVQAQGHGTASATVGGKTVTAAVASTEVALTATPDEGYQLKEWTVVSGGIDIESSKTNNPITFNMPASNVTVKAVFEVIPDKASYTMKEKATWFSTLVERATPAIEKTSITEIIFSKVAPTGTKVVDGVDLTANTTGKVKGYIVADGANYKIYIVGDYIFGNTNCQQMFSGFKSLTTLNLGHFDTSNVTDMAAMFMTCNALQTLDLSRFDTSNVTIMFNMFSGCSALKSLDLSSFDTSETSNMQSMFSGCSKLESITFGTGFKTSKVTSMTSMFNGCSALKSLDLSSFVTSEVTQMGSMFKDCSTLESLDLSKFNTKIVTDMPSMFNGCSGLTSLNLSSFDTSAVKDMNGMFTDCSSLESITFGNNFNTSQVTTMNAMFNGCSALKSLDLSSFVTSAVTNMDAMFKNCSTLKSLDLSSFVTPKVTKMSNMFNGCSTLKSLNISNFTVGNETTVEYMFKDCSELTSVKIISDENEKIKNALGDNWTYNEVNGAYEKQPPTN